MVLFIRLAAAALAQVFRPLLRQIDQSLSDSAATGEILGQQRQKRAWRIIPESRQISA